MDKKIINKKLDDLLENPKSRGFLNHLIRAYLPISKCVKVYNKPEKKMRCVLTNIPLISVSEALDGIKTEEFKEDFLTHLKSWANGDSSVQTPMDKMLKGRLLGFTGENTTTYLSQEAYQIFFDWTTMKILSGDKHINWVINSTLKNHFVDRAENLKIDDSQKKRLNTIKKKIKAHKANTTTFGDLDVLKNLKAKLNKTKVVCKYCNGTGKDGHDRCDPPNWYICEKCNGTEL